MSGPDAPPAARPRPRPDGLTRPYWDAAAEHRLVVMRCADCGRYRHPPTAVCEQCGSDEVRWEPLSGDGHVWSFIVDRRNLVPGFSGPYAVVMVSPVETGEEVRIVANLVGCPFDQIHVGMPVTVTWEDLGDGLSLPQFRPSTIR
jgi:uncharacterized OB-fold protein